MVDPVVASPHAGRPVLFLDIDGVLNSGATMEHGRLRGARPESLDAALCARLHRVLDATGCDVVLSSSWRYVVKLAEVRGWLAEKGCPGARIIGRTPLASEMGSARTAPIPGHPGARMYVDEVPRGAEIQAWLDADRRAPRPSLAIVDDSDDMAHLAPRLVRTTWALGIEDEHVARLIEMLRPPSAARR